MQDSQDDPAAPEQTVSSSEQSWRWTSLLPQLLSPIGPLLALPGMTDAWYVKEDGRGMMVTKRPDSPAVVAVGAVVFALTVLSDFCLLIRLLDNVRRFFTVLTLSIGVVHVLLLAIFDAILSTIHHERLDDGFALSTSFWLSVGAAACAAITASLLVADGFITSWWRKGGVGLSSPKQTGLVLSFNLFIGIQLVATVAFRHLLPPSEDASYLDALFFSIQCSTTVGFGTSVPTSKGARIATVLFFPLSILSFACLVGFTVSTLIEGLQDSYERREQRVMARIKPASRGTTLAQSVATLDKANRAHRRSQLVVAVVLVATVLTVGAAVLGHLEHWTFGLAIYFCAISMLTIGFGDVLPESQAGKAFFCVWILFSAAAVTILISILADRFSSRIAKSVKLHLGSRVRALLKHAEPQDLDSARARGSSSLEASPELGPNMSRLLSFDSRRSRAKDGESERPLSDAEQLIECAATLKGLLGMLIDKDRKMSEIVSAKMDADCFDPRIRETVDGDENLQKPIYQRVIRAAFEDLEVVAQRLARSERIAGSSGSRTITASRVEDHRSERTTNVP